MKKSIATLLVLALMMSLTTASAGPLAAEDHYTAWLGDENHLYLRDPLGDIKALRYPIADILSITDGQVYAITQEGRLFSIRVDGQGTNVLSEKPTAEDLAKVAAAPVFDLTEGTLSLIAEDSTKVQLATNVQHAAANGNKLFFIQMDAPGTASLMAVSLPYVAPLLPLPETLYTVQPGAISMTVTSDAVTLVNADHSVSLFALPSGEIMFFPALSEQTAAAVCIGPTLYRYTQALDGAWLFENATLLPDLVSAGTDVQSLRATATPTATPRSTATPTVTPKPTNTPTPTPEDEYPRLEYGDRSDAVRAMQKRLKALGYPVGSVDGIWGKDTQLAVNLFQHAIRYYERSYASSRMQERLFSRNAPKYDRYEPLESGDSGTPVRLMQQALFDLGYLGTDHVEEVDGYYGPITEAAIREFQTVAGEPLVPTGKADADTLMLLFSTLAPMKPTDRPIDPNYPEFITPAPSTDAPVTDAPETDAPTDETDPPAEETDQPTDETNPPTDETDQPTDETDPPADQDAPTDPNYPELIVPSKPAEDPEPVPGEDDTDPEDNDAELIVPENTNTSNDGSVELIKP